MTLPPVCARLATKALPMGFPAAATTMGITAVACFAARTFAVPDATMISTFSRTNSAANSAKRSFRPSPNRARSLRYGPRPSRVRAAAVQKRRTMAREMKVCLPQEPDRRQISESLRPCRDRHRRRRTAKQLDELAPVHSITWSARPRRGSGTARPSALAVLRLMVRSTLVACCTGSSAGFSPLRTRPVYSPTRRYASIKLLP